MKPEEIHKIVKETNITIPSWVLYTLVQYTEVSVKRGGISAGELTSVGTAYEAGSSLLAQLLKEHAVPTEQKLETIPEEVSVVHELISEPTEVPKIKKKSKKAKY